ncbi:MAG TPA: hypothetical protein VF029_02970 [Actinomycetota bacterium]
MLWASAAAWASTAFALARAPPPRYGSPYRRASWAPARTADTPSGVPKAGEPVRMSVTVKNDPYRHGVPGRTSCASAIPESASATCCARPPATLTGAVAPARRNGVTITGCPASAHAIRASVIRRSQTSGLFGFTTPISAGVSSIAARPPCTISAIAIPSRALGPLVPYDRYGASDHRIVEYSMSR